MTTETAKRIARNARADEVQTWSGNVVKFATAAHSPLVAAASAACAACPYRNNKSVGGCIGEECPVNAVRKALQLACKRTATAVKEIYKHRYAARVA